MLLFKNTKIFLIWAVVVSSVQAMEAERMEGFFRLYILSDFLQLHKMQKKSCLFLPVPIWKQRVNQPPFTSFAGQQPM